MVGVYNRITRDKYKRIKKMLKTPADDERAMAVFSICATTCRSIRLTKNYDEYCERVFRFHGHPTGGSKCKTTKTPQKESKRTRTPLNNAEMIFIIFMIGTFIFLSLLVAIEAVHHGGD